MFTKKYKAGDIIGNFTIIKCVSEKNKKHGYYLVKCVCDKEITVRTDRLTINEDCGCLRNKRLLNKKFGYGTVIEFVSKSNNGICRK